MRHRPPSHPVILAAAVLAAASVLALAMFASSPSLHTWLHESAAVAGAVDHDHRPDHEHESGAPLGSSGHACAVTLFAGGFLPLLVSGLSVSGLTWSGDYSLRFVDHVAAPFPYYRHAPSRAPPLA